MRNWSADDAESTYRIQRWGDGYFGIGSDGKLQVLPDRGASDSSIGLQDVVDELREKNIQFPVVIRFQDILKNRVRQLNSVFRCNRRSSVPGVLSRRLSD